MSLAYAASSTQPPEKAAAAALASAAAAGVAVVNECQPCATTSLRLASSVASSSS
jgi:hypothetical protein